MERSVESSKKSPFDDLSREDLITKCKGLLVLAQKAKAAKTELQNKVESYKLQLENSETDKIKGKESLQTLQELVESLTEQKLNLITGVDTAESKLKTITSQCHKYEEEIKKYQNMSISKDEKINVITQKISNLDCEIISLKRQNNRLLDENEQLINQLTELEAKTAEFNTISLQQQNQLRMLEDNVQSDEVLKKKIEELQSQLEEKLQAKEVSGESENLNYETKELAELLEAEKVKNQKLHIKLRSYKDKILKCAACINQLKNSRFILNKTVKEYSENIPKWQNEIVKASKVIEGQISDLNEENSTLKEHMVKLQKELQEIKSLLNDDTVKYNLKVDELNQENNALKSKLTMLLQQQTEKNNEYEKLSEPYKEVKHKYAILEDNVNELSKTITTLETQNVELMKLNEDIKNENNRLESSLNNKSKDNELIQNLNLQIKALESEKATIVKEKLNAKDHVADLENQNKLLVDKGTKMKTEIQFLNCQLHTVTQEKSTLEENYKKDANNEIIALKHELMTLTEQYNLLKEQHDNLQDLKGLMSEEIETLKFALEQPKDDADNLTDLNVSLQADLVKLQNKLAAYKVENASLLIEVKETRTKIKEHDTLVSEYEEAKSKLISYKTENSELLNEMKEINQVLKERGESISKQQKVISEMERLIETLEKERNDWNEEKGELCKKIEIISNDLKNAEQKTNKNSKFIDNINVEKDNALKQMEEKEAIINLLKEEIEKLKQQTSHGEMPNEDMSTSTISKAEDYSRMKDLDETFEDKYTKLRIFALKLKKKFNETKQQLESTEKDKAKLEKLLSENATESRPSTVEKHDESSTQEKQDEKDRDIFELQDKVKKMSASVEMADKLFMEVDKLRAELNNKSQDLTQERDAHKTTKENLEKARRDAKKKNVLSLEMEDYERSMKELTTKMEEKKKKMIQMESTIDTQEGTITAMKTQIKLLEEQVKTEETQNRLIKEELQHSLEEAKEKDNVILVKNSIITKLEQDLEDEKRKNEEANVEMTAILSDKEKIIISLGEDKIELNSKVKKLEFKCAEINEQLKITKIELADLKTEYTSYKVRAQAVLRQNQTVDHSQEEQLKEEAAALRAHIETLTAKLNTSLEQCSELTSELESCRRRASEASAETARAQQRTSRLQADLTRIANQLESERAQNKLQVTTLAQCYKSQITDLETKLQKETDSLKKQLAKERDSARGSRSDSLDETNHNQYMLPVIPRDDSDGEMDINVSLIPREEGEGSEAAPSPPPSKSFAGGGRRSPVPLDRLLEEGVPEDEALDAASLALTAEQEVDDLKRRLQAQQLKVKHVTVLLAESERECARMAQLSELLKAELRRVRGGAQQPHNTEYMKNVTLKFLTLPPGDERGRLVPVLQKILTLSNEETRKIQALAKGLDPNASKGWGSYLPWPGGK